MGSSWGKEGKELEGELATGRLYISSLHSIHHRAVHWNNIPKLSRNAKVPNTDCCNSSELTDLITGPPCPAFQVQCSILSHTKGIRRHRNSSQSRRRSPRYPTASKFQRSCSTFSSTSTYHIMVAQTWQALHSLASSSVVLLWTYCGVYRALFYLC